MRSGSNACLEDDGPSAATSPAIERGVALDSLAEFASEETLPRRPERTRVEDAALDAFDDEASAFADPSILTCTSTARTSPPPDAEANRPGVVLPAWRSMAAAAGIVGVVVLGLLVKPSGPLPSAPDAPRGSAVASVSENRPPDLPTTTASAEAIPPARTIEAPAEPDRPRRQDPPARQIERAGSGASSGLAARPTGAGLPSSPSATTGNVMASSPGLTIGEGLGVVLPAAGPAPEIPRANLRSLLAPDDDSPPLPAEPAPSSAQDQVRAVLRHFQAGYSRLDARFVQTIWPSVDRPRLERAFRNLEWQGLEFNECRLDVAGATASAICTGVVEYSTRVGNRRARETRRWTFALREGSAGWLIENVLMR